MPGQATGRITQSPNVNIQSNPQADLGAANDFVAPQADPRTITECGLLGARIGAATDAGPRTSREVVVFVSPRIIDFDAFLPTLVELKARRPDWRLRIVTFSRENFDFISMNTTHVAALKSCGTLYYLGWETGTSVLGRLVLRLAALLQIVWWILRCRAPVVVLGLPFTVEPYAAFRLLSRLRGGMAVTLWKFRSPDMALHRVREVRVNPPAGNKRSAIATLFRLDSDLFVHYHDEEGQNIEWSKPYGLLDNVPTIKIGMPHKLPAWTAVVAREAEWLRRELVADGVSAEAELYVMFPAKGWSVETLRAETSIEWTFELAVRTLLRLRPGAVILMRPHPKAFETPYYRRLLAEFGPRRIRIRWEHPEVLMRVARRAIFNNPSNIIFSCFDGRMIDISDYPTRHYEEFGEVSLAAGYGPLYINPHSENFDEQFAAALVGDGLFEVPALTVRRERLLSQNPTAIEPFLDVLDSGARH